MRLLRPQRLGQGKETGDTGKRVTMFFVTAVISVCCAAGVVALSRWQTKFFVAFLLMTFAVTGLCVALALRRRYFVSACTLLLMAACGITVQFRVFTNQMAGKDLSGVIGATHFGGALPELIINFFEIPAALIFFVALYKLAVRREAFPAWSGFDTLVPAFIIVSSFSLVVAENPSLTLWELFRYVKLLALYYSLRILMDRYDIIPLIVGGFIAMLFLNSAVGLAQYFADFNIPFLTFGGVEAVASKQFGVGEIFFSRTTGLIGHCNGFAAWLVCPLSFALGILFSKVRAYYKVIAFFIFFAGIAALLTTFSRAGLIGCATSFFTMTLCAVASRRIKPAISLLLAAGVVIGAIIIAQSDLGRLIYNRFVFADYGSGNARISVFLVAVKMILAHPISGIGLNNFDAVMDLFDSDRIALEMPHPVHNIYMLVASETGAVALILFLAQGIVLLYKNLLLIRRPSGETAYLIGTALFATLLGQGIVGLFDWGVVRNDYMLAQLAIIAALTVHCSMPKKIRLTARLQNS